MKRKQWMILTVTVLCLVFGSLYADGRSNQKSGNQSRQSSDQGRMRHPPHPVMTALDADRDHVISATEIAGAAKALMTLDKNGDHILSADELRPQRRGNQRQGNKGQGNQGQGNQGQSGNRVQGQGNQGQGNRSQGGNCNQGQGRNRMQPPALPAMTAMDTDNDKQLSASEIANAPKALLTLDKNKDGKLSHDEIRPPRPTGNRQNRKK